ncbi:TonB-dependent siderophore receptor [Chitinophaga arvensicola]|uniref:Iron complex outermembrane recepter protein n=1 Tax=Chitinophaga arvensicola TaxID=29529 RepID=A0A1I0RC88_9BACT|nr:TonB-dependent receptor [Chitinophaga arvensicola]SEW38454.1 iron complex outermembrane recepter protein [Chitinophaga arvensicola]
MRYLPLIFLFLGTMPVWGQSADTLKNVPSHRYTQQLSEVNISTQLLRSKDRASNYSARLPLRYLENPQVVASISGQLIREQGLTDLNSIITRNAPGVSKGWAAAASYYTVRGFNTRNYIRNGVAAYVTGDIDIANLEQLSVIKGPSGTLFGSSLVSFGGVLNRITKKPFDSTLVEIGYQGGSYGLSRFTADVNTPLNKDNTALMRLNASYHYEGSFQDAGFLRSTFIAPGFIYKASNRLTFLLDAEIYLRESTSMPQFIPTGPKQTGSTRTWAATPGELGLDYKKSYSNNSITLKNPNTGFYGQINYKISDQWMSQTNLISTRAGNTGNYLTFSVAKGDSLLARNVTQYPTGTYVTNQVQQNFTGDFKIGMLRNRIVAGLEFYQQTANVSSNALNGRGGRASFDTLNLNSAMPAYSAISTSAIDTKLSKYSAAYTSSANYTYAVYISDVLDVTDRLNVMASLRADYFDNKGTTNTTTGIPTGNYRQTAFSPKFGLVYQLLKNRLSLFANYTNGFQNVAPTTQPDGTITTFKPQYASQLEGGIKAELATDLLSATISYYNISLKNTVRPDPANPTYSIQEGMQYSNGVEADLQSRPAKGLFLNAGFGYNNSKLTSADSTVQGRRPVNSGPVTQLNGYVSYEVAGGLGIGVGANYAAKNFIINNTTNGQFYLDGYTLVNASLFYSHARYRFSITADNTGNTRYYTGGFGTFTPGALRRFTGSLTVQL